jgi:hypothetical protein
VFQLSGRENLIAPVNLTIRQRILIAPVNQPDAPRKSNNLFRNFLQNSLKLFRRASDKPANPSGFAL